MYPHKAQRRIVVTGMAGSGKSTFSRALAVKSGLPLIHLDWQRQHATRHVLESKRAIREFLDGSVDVTGRGHGDGSS
jgi:adenylate kinase family enzyme